MTTTEFNLPLKMAVCLLVLWNHLPAHGQEPVQGLENIQTPPADTGQCSRAMAIDTPATTQPLASGSPAPSALPAEAEYLYIVPARYKKHIQAWIDHYAVKQPRFVTQMLERQPAYLPMYETCLSRHSLPDELKYLSMIESNLNPRAVSPCRAVGLWQFTALTGKYYSLRQTCYTDERMDPSKATLAACQYLKDLFNQFEDWPLALAAYNCGPTRVRKAVRMAGNQRSFWAAYPYLPLETRTYVSRFIALEFVMRSLPVHRFTDVAREGTPATDTLVFNQYVDLLRLANMLAVPLRELKQLNPALKGNVVPGDAKGYCLRIPAGTKDCLTANRQAVFLSPPVRSGARQKVAKKTSYPRPHSSPGIG